jgi:hypothetical protein
MEAMTRDFFQNLYEADLAVQPDELIQLLQPKVTANMKEALCKEFSNEEISDDLF